MAYEMVMPYHLHMPSYFLETFTEYPERILSISIAFGVNSQAYGDNSKGYGVNSASLGDRSCQ